MYVQHLIKHFVSHVETRGLELMRQPSECLILFILSRGQVDNRIVRDVLQYCERLESLRLDSCIRISDSAFAPALWRPPLAGLLELRVQAPVDFPNGQHNLYLKGLACC